MTKSIADTIHDAIEHHLWDGTETHAGEQYSCWALARAEHVAHYLDSEAVCFLRELGWPEAVFFGGFRTPAECQYARALALTFAEMIAMEEGL